MFYIADLHVHSHYSRATSKNLNLESLYQWARIKGIQVVGTGDFTHPKWFSELKEKLEPDGSGLFRLKNPPADIALPGAKVHDKEVRFCLSSEISSIYKYGDKVRKNHNLVYAPDFETVSRINARLSAIGNLNADGRPILGLPSRDLLEIVTECSDRAYLVPAHVWTPWFSTLGSKGGYDSIDECFRDLSSHVFAIETGLSSDPAMNWKWSALDRFTLISNSDAHSPQKLGREANLFDTECSYDGLFNALKTQKGFLGTYEFFPEEGKYHLDGHRNCGVILSPEESIQNRGICPVCGKPLTIGVLNRVETLSDRTEPHKPESAAGFRYIIPLPEVLAELKGSGPESKTVMQAYQQAISAFGNEFTLLNDAPVEDIKRYGEPVLAEAIRRMRSGNVNPQAGYDGVYGVIRIFEEGELAKLSGQLHLFGTAPAPVKKDRLPNNIKKKEDEKIREPEVAYKAKRLNEAQQEVRDTLSGAVLVKAGPGTGKTSTLIQWISQQVTSGQAAPQEVIAITFTNKAAKEIRERLSKLSGEGIQQVNAGTFHSIAFNMLREHYPDITTVYDENSRLSIIRILFPELEEQKCKQLSQSLGRFFELGKDTGEGPLLDYAARYRQYVRSQGAIDLSDIIGELVRLWQQQPEQLEGQRSGIRSLCVDEFQDINAMQYEFVSMLGLGKNLLVIGDPDQAIYGFRGSDVKLFFRFSEDFHPKEISLKENYRSVPSVLKAAGQLISNNNLRSGIVLQPARGGRQRIRTCHASNPEKEAGFIASEIEKKVGGFHLLSGGTAYDEGDYAFADIAVLCRTRQAGRDLLPHLKKANIPVIPGDGTSFLTSKPFDLISNALRVILQQDDLIALEGILNRLNGWKQENIRSLLSVLYEKSSGWTDATLPEDISPEAEKSYGKWKNNYRKLSEQQKETDVKSIIQEAFNIFLPDPELNEEQLLKKEIILSLAEESGNDLRQFINDNCLNNYTDTGRHQGQGVHLMTFHAAKGLEFPVVFIAGAEEGTTPLLRKDSDLEEERRLFYVAMTRAKDILYLTYSEKRFRYGKEDLCHPSRFIAEISADLKDEVNLSEKTNKKNVTEKGNQLSLF